MKYLFSDDDECGWTTDESGSIEENENNLMTSFEKMRLKEKLIQGIHNRSLEHPTPIQQYSIWPCITENNVIVQDIPGTLGLLLFPFSPCVNN